MTVFLKASETKLSPEQLTTLQIAGWWYPVVPKTGARAEGEPLYRTDDVKAYKASQG